ncbi:MULTISPECIES: sulfotransferase domain-containing protein [unclassified Mesorhizobium]|uniref:sulfotransferase domain-containing protein n=1 Tax=unclassified Mesorhizobium TaxID=325217 RepID=UPI000FD93C8B|nr:MULTISPECIES: sulfotransferase domain-containing protein [unclassified Mesorhizobium]TGQ07507.1 sulfotransferase [Mesorhizobium sp. M2E.F.Ca.ET.219.01.1.1]TGT74180.1 sulfotransferase [Mesorhizobium sp. M2E.F.Ca.ET.166.01.1.1]TGW00694.1 sulfotransferase [Mesorhizobium sp. M2E.F.Ca.ET.154.01.1.1]
MDLARKSEALLREAARRPIREIRRLALDLKRLWRLWVKSDTARYNKIFIAGCARSGTTLTQRLMGCFEDTFVHQAEARYAQLDMLDRPEANLVVKRSERTHAHLARLPRAIGLIYCVRHPFDVLTSSHPESRGQRRFHVTPERWLAEYDAFLRLRKAQPSRAIVYARYEDMIARPDAVQERIAQAFDLKSRIRFSEDPSNPIRATSLKKWERNEEFRTYLHRLPPIFLARLKGFCDEFGYDMPDWARG